MLVGIPVDTAGHVAVAGCLAPCLGSCAERAVTPPKTGEQAGLETHHEQATHGEAGWTPGLPGQAPEGVASRTLLEQLGRLLLLIPPPHFLKNLFEVHFQKYKIVCGTHFSLHKVNF